MTDYRDPQYHEPRCDYCDDEYPECGRDPGWCGAEAMAEVADRKRKARKEDGDE